MSATWRRRRPVGLTRDGVPSNTAFFPRDAQDLAMSQVLSQCAWSDVCMHVAECVVRCMYACAWSDACMHVRGPMYVCMSQVLSQSVFSQSVSRECFQGVFSESVFILSSSFFPWWCGFQLPLDGLCLSMAFASRWPLPLDGLCLLMVSRWPLDGLSMASRWPLDGLSMGCLTSPSPSSTTLAEGSRCGKKDQQGACAWRGGGKTGESGSPKLPRSLFAPSLRSPRP